MRAVSVPVLGIGGISADRVPDIARSGAAGVAAIGLFIGDASARSAPNAGAGHARCLAVALDETTRAIRAGFDTFRTAFLTLTP